ncbi:hypothetical protein Ssi03_36470 [Sphaerisporangium siamense]|nr:hypothetical protein Ssi03_36470 [Sphaerisporangium siamense]
MSDPDPSFIAGVVLPASAAVGLVRGGGGGGHAGDDGGGADGDEGGQEGCGDTTTHGNSFDSWQLIMQKRRGRT